MDVHYIHIIEACNIFKVNSVTMGGTINREIVFRNFLQKYIFLIKANCSTMGRVILKLFLPASQKYIKQINI